MTHRATFRFSYPTARRARAVEAALRPEVGRIEGGRSGSGIRRDGATLSVVIDADDPTALRAAKHTWLSLVQVAEEATGGG